MEQITNNWEEHLKDILDNSIIIHRPTLEFLIKQKAIEELYLFIFYCYCSKLQKNYRKIWASNDFVRRNLGIRKQNLIKAKKQLTDWGIIETKPYKEKVENSNKQVIKKWFVEIKPLLDADKIISQLKSPEVPSPEVPKSRGWKREPQFLSNNIEFLSNNNNNMSDKPTFSLKDEIQKLLTDKRRHIQIIGLWIQEMGLRPENQEQVQSIIHRNVRPAKLLIGYKDEDIIETIKTLKKTDYLQNHFTLETIAKFIDNKVANRKKRGPKIIRWEEVPQPDGTIAMRPIYEKQTI